MTCQCKNGFYGVANTTNNTLTCTACNSNCLTCNYTSTNCTSCSSPNFLYQGSCIANCAIQTIPSYGNVTDRNCYSCGTNCNYCTSATMCTSCIVNATLTTYNHNGICLTTCPTSSLTNAVAMTCDDCGSNCAHCVSSTSNCDACNTNYYLYGTSCLSACPNGYYPDNYEVC